MVIYSFFSRKIKIYCIFITKYLHNCRKICNFVRKIKWTMKRTMKHTSLTIIFLIIGFTCVRAVPAYDFSSLQRTTLQTQKMMQTGSKYSGIIYAPFESATPAEQSNIGSTSGRHVRKSTISNNGDWEDLPDYGQTDLSPLGEPWILAIFAVVFAGIIAWKNRTLKRDHHGTISRK